MLSSSPSFLRDESVSGGRSVLRACCLCVHGELRVIAKFASAGASLRLQCSGTFHWSEDAVFFFFFPLVFVLFLFSPDLFFLSLLVFVN